MDDLNYFIWIEAEQWESGWNPADNNSDVMVSFEKGGEWVATFFSYKNISTLIEKNMGSGECLQGKYFWASEMILVDEVSRERIEEVVRHLIKAKEFENVFSLCD